MPLINRIFASITALLICIQSADAENKTPEEAISSYNYQGISLGAKLDDVRKKYPQISLLPKQSEIENGVKAFCLEPAPSVNAVIFWFLDDQLFQTTLLYNVSTVNKFGGWITLLERLVEKYGKADPSSPGENVKTEKQIASYFWYFPDSSRGIELKVNDTYATVEFSDSKLYNKWQNRKKQKADVGF